ncbi:hypothetical protein CHS0354_009499 [Potamilus streckersoni]|uniref:Lysophosphatidic acid phosphatase type 6 n=1 Tax=Potamilus streckersoni TaxID=2493646 RepID=A0AAE0VJF4_9BIVA|nr:hypothetical protein CHS0354_009499 [Potamilus streckersoni]
MYYRRKLLGLFGLSVCGGCVIRVILNSKHILAEEKAKPHDKIEELRELKLKQAQVIFRHGARTPIAVIPDISQANYTKDQFSFDVAHTIFKYEELSLDGRPKTHSAYDEQGDLKPKLKGGSNVGMLTPLGQEQMYLFGKELKREYMNKAKLLSPEYNPEEIYVRSTNIKRTRTSARCVLAGMFGSTQLNSLQEPLKLYVDNLNTDFLIPQTNDCHVLHKITHNAVEYWGDLPEIKRDRLLVEKNIGLDSTNGGKKIDFIYARDDIVARKTHGLPVPKVLLELEDLIDRRAVEMLLYSFCGLHKSEQPLATRLTSGRFLSCVLENMQKKNGPKLYLFSAHDSTIVGVLHALNIFDNQWPPFAANIRFELYEDSKKTEYVKIKYNGQDKVVRGCEKELCTLSDFKKAISKYTVQKQEYESLCASNTLGVTAKVIQKMVKDDETKEQSNTPVGM